MAEIEDHSEDPNWAPKQDMSLLCRVCANQHDYLIPIFEGEGLDHDMPNKMEKHLPIKVRENDKLPTQMCYQCASTIIAWSDLHTNCLEANKKLNHMLKINEKKFVEMGPEDEDAASDHYEDTYEAPSGGGDEDDEDFEKEIKQLISDAGVELDSSSSGTSKFRKILPKPTSKQVASKTPSKPAKVSRKRKSETSTPVKKESKKSKSDVGASSSGTVALLKPKEENVNSDDRCMIWSCCKCICNYSSWSQLGLHLLSHSISQLEDDDLCPVCRYSMEEFHCVFIDKWTILHCRFCDQVFTNKKLLEVHIKLKHGDDNIKWYKCDFCNDRLRRIGGLTLHKRVIHNQCDFDKDVCLVRNVEDITTSCVECGVLCVLSNYCSDHTQSEPATLTSSSKCIEHTNLFPNCHSCQKCDELFSDCKLLWTHMFLNHEDSEFVCNLCKIPQFKGLLSCPVVIRHMQTIHHMNFSIPHVTNLLHLRTKVESTTSKYTTKYKCPKCPDKYFLGFRKLRDHLLVHSDEKFFPCDECEVEFRRKRELQIHKNFKHKEYQPQLSFCSVCGKTFKSPNYLKTHMSIHSEEKNFVCNICGAAFKQKAGLVSHKFIHGEKNYTCSFCGISFKHPNNLREHTNFIHLKLDIPRCDYCAKQFARPESLKNHIARVHRTERPFVCAVCNSSYATRKEQLRHYRAANHRPEY